MRSNRLQDPYTGVLYEVADWLHNYRQEGRDYGWLTSEQELAVADLIHAYEKAYLYEPVNDRSTVVGILVEHYGWARTEKGEESD